MENAENRYAFIADVDLIHEDIWQPPHHPLSCSRRASRTTGIWKIAQNFRRLADAGTDPCCGSGIRLINIFADRQELRPRTGAKAERYRPNLRHTSSISVSLAILPSRTSRLANSTSATCWSLNW